MDLLETYLRRAKAMERTQLIKRYMALVLGGFLMFAAGMLIDIHINGVEMTAWDVNLCVPLFGRSAHAYAETPPG